jgi:YesN/AraC family two-component response regulator
MPKMDGVELLEAVKKIKPEIPIVMIRSWRYGNGY